MKKHLFKAFALVALAVVGLGQQMRAMPIPVPQAPDKPYVATVPLTPGATESEIWDVYVIKDPVWRRDLLLFGGRERFPNDNTATKFRPLVGFVYRPRNVFGDYFYDTQGHIFTYVFTFNPTGSLPTEFEGQVRTVTCEEVMGNFLTQAGGWCRDSNAVSSSDGTPCLWANWNGFPVAYYPVPMPFPGPYQGTVTCMTSLANSMTSGGAHLAGYCGGGPFESHFTGGPQVWTTTLLRGRTGVLQAGSVGGMSADGLTLCGTSYGGVSNDAAIWQNGGNAQISFLNGGFTSSNDAGTMWLGTQTTSFGRETVVHQASGTTFLKNLTFGQSLPIYGGMGVITGDNDLWPMSWATGFPSTPYFGSWQASTGYRFKWNGSGWDTEQSASNYLGAFPSIGTLAANFDSVLGQDSSPFGVTICGSVGNVGNRRGVIAYVPAALRY